MAGCLPHQFADTRGRVWSLEVHPHAMRRVREATGFVIGTALNDDMRGLRDLFADVILFCDVLYELVRDDATRGGVTPEDFGKALGGGVVEAAADAFVRALANFSRSQVRTPLLALAEKERQLRERAAAKATAAIDTIDVDAVLAEISNASAGNSPASPGSTPAG